MNDLEIMQGMPFLPLSWTLDYQAHVMSQMSQEYLNLMVHYLYQFSGETQGNLSFLGENPGYYPYHIPTLNPIITTEVADTNRLLQKSKLPEQAMENFSSFALGSKSYKLEETESEAQLQPLDLSASTRRANKTLKSKFSDHRRDKLKISNKCYCPYCQKNFSRPWLLKGKNFFIAMILLNYEAFHL